jgi:hypothetical protein
MSKAPSFLHDPMLNSFWCILIQTPMITSYLLRKKLRTNLDITLPEV